ncbi:MAG: hypothetical protein LBJ64_04820 [Deltaproteobacteria bacterium]|jgi:thymidine kinase|nr:hypothetical protein [Deltaproteobacteria bacterium]
MKIRQGFVTNSSSTSFVMAMKEEFTVENFFKAFGIGKKFVLTDMFEEIFNIIKEGASEMPDLAAFEKEASYYPEENLAIVKDLFSKGWKVYCGCFEDDYGGNPFENFLSKAPIFVHNSIIFFDASETSY